MQCLLKKRHFDNRPKSQASFVRKIVAGIFNIFNPSMKNLFEKLDIFASFNNASANFSIIWCLAFEELKIEAVHFPISFAPLKRTLLAFQIPHLTISWVIFLNKIKKIAFQK